MSFSVIIPSKTPENLRACVAAIRQNEPDLPPDKIITVDDGLSYAPKGIRVVPGIKPFVYARNCNIGIRAAFDAPVTYDVTAHSSLSTPIISDPNPHGVILLNDDALLQTPQGFTKLAEIAAASPDYGVVAAASNSVGNRAQFPQNATGIRQERRMVCFVCVYIPRATLDKVGLIDERYIHYGMDDDDYCLMVRKAGLKLGIFDGCFVDHRTLKSSFRGHGAGDYRPNLEIFKQKWGHDNFGVPA